MTKKLTTPAIEWMPHAVTFHGDSRVDPFYWLRGPAKRKSEENSTYDLGLFHHTVEEYKAKGVSRDSSACPRTVKSIKKLLREENAYVDTFLPWRLKMSDELTGATVCAVLGNTESGDATPNVTVREAIKHSPQNPAISPLVTMPPLFPASQMISGIVPAKKKGKKDEMAPTTLETPVHYIYSELRKRVFDDDTSIPHHDGRFWYFTRTVAKKEYPIYCRRKYCDGSKNFLKEVAALHAKDPSLAALPCDWETEEVLLDINLLEEEHGLDFIETADIGESPSHTKMVVAVDMSDGQEIFTLLVFDISSLSDLPTDPKVGGYKQLKKNPPILRKIDALDCCGECTFITEDILAFTVMDAQQRSYRLILHDLRLDSSDSANNVVMYEETDPRYSIGSLAVSDSDIPQRFFYFSTTSKDGAELHHTSIDGHLDTIADIVARSSCFVSRPPSEVRSEVSEAWHGNLNGTGGSGWFLVHNREPYRDFTLGYVLNADIVSGDVMDKVLPLIEVRDKMVVENIESQRDYILLSVRENGFSNCYLFGIKEVQHIVQRQRENPEERLLFSQGISLSKWIGSVSGSVEVSASASLFSIDASVSVSDTYASPSIRLVVGHYMRLSEIWEVDAEYLLSNNAVEYGALKIHTEHLPGPPFNPDHYEALILQAPVKLNCEGTEAPDVRIPIMLCYRKDTFTRGAQPLILDVYGSYGDCYDAEFSRNRLSLLDRGVVCAIAWVRGGGEMGRGWRDDGRLQTRNNSITDLSECARFLINEGWSAKDKLVIRGGSAGGTVVCGAMLHSPELFHGVMASVPFVDCLTTMLDPNIPLTTLEWEEWGNPVKDKEAYKWIKQYSPMDNIPCFDMLVQDPAEVHPTNLTAQLRAGATSLPSWAEAKDKVCSMPHMYVDSGFGDSRVAYWEPMAFVSRIRAVQNAMEKAVPGWKKPLVLHRCQMGAGHAGASGRFAYLKDIAREYAFLLNIWGIIPKLGFHEGGSDSECDWEDGSDLSDEVEG